MMDDIFEFNEKNHLKIPALFKRYSSSVQKQSTELLLEDLEVMLLDMHSQKYLSSLPQIYPLFDVHLQHKKGTFVISINDFSREYDTARQRRDDHERDITEKWAWAHPLIMVVRHNLRLQRTRAKKLFGFDRNYVDIFEFKKKLQRLGVELNKKVAQKFCRKISLKQKMIIDFRLFQEILDFYEDQAYENIDIVMQDGRMGNMQQQRQQHQVYKDILSCMEGKYKFNQLFVAPFSHKKVGQRGKISTNDFFDVIDLKLNMPENEDRDQFIMNLADKRDEIDIDFLREQFYPNEDEEDLKLLQMTRKKDQESTKNKKKDELEFTTEKKREFDRKKDDEIIESEDFDEENDDPEKSEHDSAFEADNTALRERKFEKKDVWKNEKLIHKIIKTIMKDKSIVRVEDKFFQEGQDTINQEEFISIAADILYNYEVPVDQIKSLFDFIDIHDDGSVSRNEFGRLFDHQGRRKREQSIYDQEVEASCQTLFKEINTDNTGKIDFYQFQKVFAKLGMALNPTQLQIKFHEIDSDNSGFLEYNEFKPFVMQQLQKYSLKQDELIINMRREFNNVDIMQEGSISHDQLLQCFKNLDIVIPKKNISELLEAIDTDRDGKIDIDEFMEFMKQGLDDKDQNNVFSDIKKNMRIDPQIIFETFKKLPVSFTKSVIGHQNQKLKNLPSSIIQLELKSSKSFYRNLRLVTKQEQLKQVSQSYVKQVEVLQSGGQNEVGQRRCIQCEVKLDFATGVPLPPDEMLEGKNKIVAREIKICLFNQGRMEFIGNSLTLPVYWEKQLEDEWQFKTKRDKSQVTNHVYVRSVLNNDDDFENVVLLFELVLLMKEASETVQVSCGWATLPFTRTSDIQKFSLTIRGGSPLQPVDLDKKQVKARRQGFSAFVQKFSNAVQSRLYVQVYGEQKIPKEFIEYLQVLQPNCILRKGERHFIRVIREYQAKFAYTVLSKPQKLMYEIPIKVIANVMNCPDTANHLLNFWNSQIKGNIKGENESEDAWAREKWNRYIDIFESLMKGIYPIMTSLEFGFNEMNPTEYVHHKHHLPLMRIQYLNSALAACIKDFEIHQRKVKAEEGFEFVMMKWLMPKKYKRWTIQEFGSTKEDKRTEILMMDQLKSFN